mmetsp:Transcript_42413/g.90242  ORF Transcript_42413/g.90242 Transcript_42413/m.90242 type:complete len:203 (-) Transcript_42413:37-645(-)
MRRVSVPPNNFESIPGLEFDPNSESDEGRVIDGVIVASAWHKLPPEGLPFAQLHKSRRVQGLRAHLHGHERIRALRQEVPGLFSERDVVLVLLLDVNEGVGVDDPPVELAVQAADALLQGAVLGLRVGEIIAEHCLWHVQNGTLKKQPRRALYPLVVFPARLLRRGLLFCVHGRRFGLGRRGRGVGGGHGFDLLILKRLQLG